MLANKKCPAGKYCYGGLKKLADARECALGHYCEEGFSRNFFFLFYHFLSNLKKIKLNCFCFGAKEFKFLLFLISYSY